MLQHVIKRLTTFMVWWTVYILLPCNS